jgi:uncharacterized protein
MAKKHVVQHHASSNKATMDTVKTVSLVLVLVGALNWGLVGLLNINLVEALFGAWPALTQIVYILVGLAGLYAAWTMVVKK